MRQIYSIILSITAGAALFTIIVPPQHAAPERNPAMLRADRTKPPPPPKPEPKPKPGHGDDLMRTDPTPGAAA